MSVLAINGGTPVRTTEYPKWPAHGDDERDRLLAVLDSGDWWSTDGRAVKDFESAWGEFHGTPPAVAVTNGTHAIELLLSALGIGEGDEVIVPDWTFLATASAVLAVNAVPILVDVDFATGCIDPNAIEAVITPRTTAVIAVHIAGHPADMDRLVEICTRHAIALLEDCAHAHGSTWKGQPVATFGAGGSYSFQASKLMTAGEGGAIVSSDPGVLARTRSFADCGREPKQWFYSHYRLGGNYRMTEWQGAILLAQLARFPAQQARRNANATFLNNALAEIPGVIPQRRDPRCTSQGNYCYVARIDADEFGASREAVRLALRAEGIPMTMAYPPIHRLDVFADRSRMAPRFRDSSSLPDYAALDLPVSQRLADETLWFRTAAIMGSSDDTADVVTALRKIQQHAAELADVE